MPVRASDRFPGSTMRILCPIQYEIQGVTNTNRRLKNHAFIEIVSFDIPGVDTSDAPVAVEWTPDTDAHKYDTQYPDRAISGPDGRQLTRWHENSHWQRLCDGHFYGKKSLGKVVTVERLQSMLNDPTQDSAALTAIRVPPSNSSKPASKFSKTDGDPRDKFTDIKVDGRSLVIQSYQEAFKGLIAVDGCLYRKSVEPYVSVELVLEEDRLVVDNVGIETTSGSLWGPTTKMFAVFGLGNMDKAVEFISDHSRATTKGGTAVPAVDVLVDEALTYDWDVSYPAAATARTTQNLLSMYSFSRDPKLEEVIASQDAEEQYQILTSIGLSEPRWAQCQQALRSFEELMDILDNRRVSLSPVTAGFRP